MDNEILTKESVTLDPSLTQDPSLPELLGQLAKSSAAMVYDQIELIIQRFREKARAVQSAAIFISIGGVISFIAILCFCSAVIIWLSYYMSPVLAALVTGGALALVGIAFIFIGYKKLKNSIHQN